MSKKIRTYQDLLEMKEVLEAKLTEDGRLIQHDIATLREEWRPITQVLSGLAKLTNKGRSNPFLAIGIDILGDVLLRRVLPMRSGWLTKLVVPFVAKTFSTHFLNGNGGSIVRNLIDRFVDRKTNGQLKIEN